MLFDARELPDNANLKTDICIVGAGAAGITIARELINTKLNVCLLESGGLEYDVETQSLYEGKNIGVETWPHHVSRLRYFGGTTNHWGGVCLPLDEDDFKKRDWVKHSGWPLSLDDLIPYYRRAQPILELKDYNYEPEIWEMADFKKLPFKDKRVLTRMLQRSAPTRFGQTYREAISQASNINTYLYANVLDIDINESATEVTQLNVSCYHEKQFTVSANTYILALGGIENPRLLLLSDSVQKTGLGNQYDLVGRYFADHPYLSQLGFIVLSDGKQSTNLYERIARDKLSASAFLTLSPQTRQENQLLTSRIHIPSAEWTHYSSGNAALESLSDGEGTEDVKSFASKLYRVLKDLDDVTRSKYDQAKNARLLNIGAWTEIAPNPESRVYLSEEHDDLGQRQVTLDWRIGEQEKRKFNKNFKHHRVRTWALRNWQNET